MIPFQRIQRENASEAISRQLLDFIRSGQLEVGSRLPAEEELARSFGVSRPSVREALGVLRGLGVLTSINGRGNYISPAALARPPLLGRYPIAELYEVRCHLEIPGAALAAERRTDEQLAKLETVVAALEACSEPAEWVRHDAAFHVALAEATGNQVQSRLVEHLRDLLIEQSLAIVSALAGRIPEATQEHRDICEAVADRDAARARAAMYTHLLAGSGSYDPEIKLAASRESMDEVFAAHGITVSEGDQGTEPQSRHGNERGPTRPKQRNVKGTAKAAHGEKRR
jgi:GntR family transcriptional repressor for pyruvate dehydrogenase complex